MPRPVAAALCMIVASALVAATTLMAKTLGRGVIDGSSLHPLQVTAGRFVFAWLTLLPFVLWRRPSLRTRAWPLHLGRSFCGWTNVTLLFAAAQAMPLAEATAISFLSPLITMLLAIPLLGERVGPWRWTAAGVALAGAVLLIRPGTDTFQVAALLALAAAVFMGLETTLIKKLTRIDAPIRILFINNTLGAMMAIATASFVWVSPSPVQWALLAGIGVVMVCAQGFVILSLKWADASFAIPFFYATLVFAALYDLAVFAVVPSRISMAGAALVIGGAIVLAWREGRHAKPPQSH